MIVSFGNKLTEHLFDDLISKETRRIPDNLRRIFRRKLLYLHEADMLADLRVPPGNRLEVLSGDFKGYHSIRINDQWRLVFKWDKAQVSDVQIIDYH
jgi:proteic killer suppression protein